MKILGEEEEKHRNPLNGRWTLLSVVLAVGLGLSSLLFFLTPQQIRDSFREVSAEVLLSSLCFFFLGCWVSVERWRACLNFRADRWTSFHTLGVANAGNLLIPGRIGEPLRIYLLARLGVAPEFGTSALVQERLADQLLRVVFLSVTVLLLGVSGGGELWSRLAAVSMITLLVAGLILALVKGRRKAARKLGNWLGKLPVLEPEPVERYVLSTLKDLGESWTHPGGKKALLWGLLAWLAFTVHSVYILDAFFATQTLAMAMILIALVPATAPTQPGLFHGFAAGGILMLGGSTIPALQASVVLHMIQMVIYSLWGITSWLVLDWRLTKGGGRATSAQT